MAIRVALLVISVVSITAQQETITEGRIVNVTKSGNKVTEVRVNVGSKLSVQAGWLFDVFSLPEVIQLPNGETAYKKEKKIAEIMVVKPEENESTAKIDLLIEAGAEMAVGMRVRLSDKTIRAEVLKLFPAIKGASTVPLTPSWGELAHITVELADFDGDLKEVTWSSRDAQLADDKSFPILIDGKYLVENSFYPAHGVSTVNISVRAVDAHGNSTEASIPVNCSTEQDGAIEKVVVEGVIGGKSKHFVEARALKFDSAGRAMILDSNLRRFIRLTKQFRVDFNSDEIAYDSEFVDFAAVEQYAYFVDSVNNEVRAYEIKGNMFAQKPFKTVSARKDKIISAPSAIEADSAGSLYVLDKKQREILVFSKDLILVATVKMPQIVSEPAAIATHGDELNLLDSARNSVFVFKNLRFTKEIDLKMPKEKVNAFTVCGDKLIVSTGDKLFQATGSGSDRIGINPEIRSVSSLTSDAYGTVYALRDRGRSIVRLSGGGDVTGIWGGEDFSGSTTFDVSSSGMIAVLNAERSVMWTHDNHGWMTKKIQLPKHAPISMALLDSGDAYIIDSDRKRVLHVTNGETKWLTEFGHVYAINKWESKAFLLDEMNGKARLHWETDEPQVVEVPVQPRTFCVSRSGCRFFVLADSVKVFDSGEKEWRDGPVLPVAAPVTIDCDDSGVLFMRGIADSVIHVTTPGEPSTINAGKFDELRLDKYRKLYLFDKNKGQVTIMSFAYKRNP